MNMKRMKCCLYHFSLLSFLVIATFSVMIVNAEAEIKPKDICIYTRCLNGDGTITTNGPKCVDANAGWSDLSGLPTSQEHGETQGCFFHISIGAEEVKPNPQCFIATAAYGTGDENEVVILRKFRDQHLLKNSIGRKFVKAYYKYSPPIADYISDKPSLRRAVRIMLKPLVWMSDKLTK